MVPGTVTITATSYDQYKIATCEVTVIPSSNFITNPGFELGEESWDVTGNTSAVTFENDAYKGDKALHYFNGDFEASQTITGLENGWYKLSAWASGAVVKKLQRFLLQMALDKDFHKHSQILDGRYGINI